MRLQTLLQDPAASEEAIHFSQFFLKVKEELVSEDASTLFDLPEYIHKIDS